MKFDYKLPDQQHFLLSYQRKKTKKVLNLGTDTIIRREPNIIIVTWFFCFFGVNMEDELETDTYLLLGLLLWLCRLMWWCLIIGTAVTELHNLFVLIYRTVKMIVVEDPTKFAKRGRRGHRQSHTLKTRHSTIVSFFLSFVSLENWFFITI